MRSRVLLAGGLGATWTVLAAPVAAQAGRAPSPKPEASVRVSARWSEAEKRVDILERIFQ
jgi:hypothetical protein